jgi:hypothetical protein
MAGVYSYPSTRGTSFKIRLTTCKRASRRREERSSSASGTPTPTPKAAATIRRPQTANHCLQSSSRTATDNEAITIGHKPNNHSLHSGSSVTASSKVTTIGRPQTTNQPPFEMKQQRAASNVTTVRNTLLSPAKRLSHTHLYLHHKGLTIKHYLMCSKMFSFLHIHNICVCAHNQLVL